MIIQWTYDDLAQLNGYFGGEFTRNWIAKITEVTIATAQTVAFQTNALTVGLQTNAKTVSLQKKTIEVDVQ